MMTLTKTSWNSAMLVAGSVPVNEDASSATVTQAK